MKRLLIFGLMMILLASCGESKPAHTDNGNPGQIKAIVFYDDNKNGMMQSVEKGASQRVAISQEVSCPPAQFRSNRCKWRGSLQELKAGRVLRIC
jgi:hypothetical protein